MLQSMDGADRDLDLLGGALTDHGVVGLPNVANDRLIELVAGGG